MEHPPTSSAFADHAAIITELRSLLDDANADIARRHLDMNKAMGRVYAAEARIEDRDATIANLRSQLEALNTVSSDLRAEVEVANKALAEARKNRASIVAFLAAEAKRRDKDARSRVISPDAQDRLRGEAVLCRTLELAIERGDDRQGGE